MNEKTSSRGPFYFTSRTRSSTSGSGVQRYSWRRVPPGHWADSTNRRTYLDFLKSQLGSTYDALYSVDSRVLASTGGASLLSTMKLSPAELIIQHFPEHPWLPWKFKRLPAGWWTSLAQRFKAGDQEAAKTVRGYLDDLAARVGVQTPEDWASVPHKALKRHDKWRVSYFGGLGEMLRQLQPGLPLPDAKAPAVRRTALRYTRPKFYRGHWKTPEGDYLFLDFLKSQSSASNAYESFHSVTFAQLVQAGGKMLLEKYSNSASLAVMNTLPDHAWLPWSFAKMPRGHWATIAGRFKDYDPLAVASIRILVDEIGEKHGVRQLEDWYSVPLTSLGRRVTHQLDYLGRLVDVLVVLHPIHSWQPWRFDSKRKKLTTQLSLADDMAQIFPTESMGIEVGIETLNFRLPVGFTSAQIEGLVFDIVFGRHRLIAEYHGENHYLTTAYGGSDDQAKRDQIKRELCQLNGFTFLEVPYWWNGSRSQLLNSLHSSRPDLIGAPTGDGTPIPRLGHQFNPESHSRSEN